MDGQLAHLLTVRPHSRRRDARPDNVAENAEQQAALNAEAETVRLARLRARRERREANLQAHDAAFPAVSSHSRPLMEARRLLKALPPPREACWRWVELPGRREVLGREVFEPEMVCRLIERVGHALMMQPERSAEILGALVLSASNMLDGLDGVPVPPFARIVTALDAGPDALGKALMTKALDPDIEAVRVLLRAGQPVITSIE